MTTTEYQNFRRLLTAWNDHQDLRRLGAAPADLYASRVRLDSARADARYGA